MDLSRETENFPATDMQIGQGAAMPPVPPYEVPCEKCTIQIELVEGKIPELCPHCGYHLRPGKCSTLHYFFFLLRRRMFTWRGRCTRKELWSFLLFSYLLLFLFILALVPAFVLQLPDSSCEVAYLGVFFYVSLTASFAYILFIGIPQVFLIARRLHDIGLSGITVIIHLIITVLLFCVMVVTFLIEEKVASEMHSAGQLVTQFYSNDAIQLGDKRNPIIQSLIIVASLMNLTLHGLNLFFFVIALIDSERGTNKYGPSRKYPLALS